MSVKLHAGKIPPETLRRFLGSLPGGDASVVASGEIGEDAALIDNGGPELLVAKTDPITFATVEAGRYLLAVNGNDLATMGAEPRWLLVTVLLPEGIAVSQAEAVLAGVRAACIESGVSLVGGHTEITVGLDRPILVGCLLGTVPRERVFRTSGARPGDAVLLTGGIAMEGAAILAREHSATLLARGVDRHVIERAAAWLERPGISILPAARILREIPSLRSMHDPTEGGLATALGELAEAASVGIRIEESAIPVLPECEVICRALGLNPLGLLASGSLLATLDPADVPVAIERLRSANIRAARIGEILPVNHPNCSRLHAFARDELARYLESR